MKAELAGKRGICPECGAQFIISAQSEPPPTASVAAPSTAPFVTKIESADVPNGAEGIPELTIATAPTPPPLRAVRQRVRRKKQVTVTLGLAVLVAVLGAVLLWIIFKQPT